MPSPAEPAIVLGSDGFIGRHLVRTLHEQGRPVTAIGRAAGDFADWSAVERALAAAPKAGDIFHLITRQRTGPIQYKIQGELLAINARIHLNVLEAWRRHQPQAKLISAGSSCVYPESERPIPESAFRGGPLHPSVRGYGLAKELLIVGSGNYASRYGLKYLHCVLATVYGPGDHKSEHRSHFMAGMIDRAVREKQAGAPFTVWGAPDTVRDLLYVDDQIAAILAANRAFENEIVNCGSNQPITIDQAARTIVAALDWQGPIVYLENTFRGTHSKSIDSSKFLTTTGWKPRVNLAAGVEAVLEADYKR